MPWPSGYHAVVSVDSTELETAYLVTQNIELSKAERKLAHRIIGTTDSFGHRSTSVNDIVVVNDGQRPGFYLCAPAGWEPLPASWDIAKF